MVAARWQRCASLRAVVVVCGNPKPMDAAGPHVSQTRRDMGHPHAVSGGIRGRQTRGRQKSTAGRKFYKNHKAGLVGPAVSICGGSFV